MGETREEMKTIIAGSREGVKLEDVVYAVENCGWTISEVVSGCARGADKMGEEIASALNIPVARFPANWKLYGRRAGYRRNEQMAENAEALIAVWDGQSKGTMHMINIASQKGLKVFVHTVQ